MSRRTRKPLPKRNAGDRPKGARPYRGSQAERAHGHRPGSKPAKRLVAPAARAPKPVVAGPTEDKTALLPTKVQTVTVTAARNNMRVVRFLVERFPRLA